MKILFSNPPWWIGREFKDFRIRWRAGVRAGSRWPFTYLLHRGISPDHFKFGSYLPYPFFMGYASSYLKKYSGLDVRLRDSIALRESYRKYFEYLKKERFEYIFIESAGPSFEHDKDIIMQIKKMLPDTKIVLCGSIVGADANMVINELPVHACIKGEYEKGSLRVIKGESGIIDFDFLSTAEMNAAPFPYYDDTIYSRYCDLNPKGQIFPHAQVWGSRGCPFKCIFCVWPATMTGNDQDGHGKRLVRYYSADYMEAFLKELTAKYPFKSIYFDDDTFNLGDAHVKAICDVMTRIKLPWSAMCRADTIDISTWKIMKDAGCFGVKLGIESGSQWVLDNIINKGLDLEKVKSAVSELKRLGIFVHGTFTYGLPGETAEQMLQTKEFAASLPFDTIQESGTAEIAGTPLSKLRSSGTLDKYAGAKMDTSHAAETDGNIKITEIKKFFRRG